MNDLKFRKFDFKIERNNKDGTKSKISTEKLDLKHEMILIGIIDSSVDKLGYQDADKLIEYIKNKK